jgi:outer membrane autotransporter protein
LNRLISCIYLVIVFLLAANLNANIVYFDEGDFYNQKATWAGSTLTLVNTDNYILDNTTIPSNNITLVANLGASTQAKLTINDIVGSTISFNNAIHLNTLSLNNSEIVMNATTDNSVNIYNINLNNSKLDISGGYLMVLNNINAKTSIINAKISTPFSAGNVTTDIISINNVEAKHLSVGLDPSITTSFRRALIQGNVGLGSFSAEIAVLFKNANGDINSFISNKGGLSFDNSKLNIGNNNTQSSINTIHTSGGAEGQINITASEINFNNTKISTKQPSIINNSVVSFANSVIKAEDKLSLSGGSSIVFNDTSIQVVNELKVDSSKSFRAYNSNIQAKIFDVSNTNIYFDKTSLTITDDFLIKNSSNISFNQSTLITKNFDIQDSSSFNLTLNSNAKEGDFIANSADQLIKTNTLKVSKDGAINMTIDVANSGSIKKGTTQYIEVINTKQVIDEQSIDRIFYNTGLSEQIFNIEYDIIGNNDGSHSYVIFLTRHRNNSFLLDPQKYDANTINLSLIVDQLINEEFDMPNQSVENLITALDKQMGQSVDDYVTALKTTEPINSEVLNLSMHNSTNLVKGIYSSNKENQGVWVSTGFSFNSINNKKNSTSHDDNISAVVVGGTINLGKDSLGMAIGNYSGKLESDNYSGKNNGFVGIIEYNMAILSSSYFGINVLYGLGKLENSKIDFIENKAEGTMDVSELSFGAEIGTNFNNTEEKISFNPRAYYSYSTISNKGYEEKGDGLLFKVDANITKIQEAGVGFNIIKTFQNNVRPQVDFKDLYKTSKISKKDNSKLDYIIGINVGYALISTEDSVKSSIDTDKIITQKPDKYSGFMVGGNLGVNYEFNSKAAIALNYKNNINFDNYLNNMIIFSFKYKL